MQIIKEESRNIKRSILRYHRELRRELGEGWIQSLRPELEQAVQCLLGKDWKKEAEKYLHLTRRRRGVLILPNKEEKEKEIKKVKIQRKKKENQKRMQMKRKRENQKKEEGRNDMREEKVTEEGKGE